MAFPARFFPVQGIYLGPTGSITTFDNATLMFPGQLGMVLEDSGNVYRLVLRSNTANVATSAGFAAQWKDRVNFVVTSKASEAQAGVNGIAGAFLASMTNGNYCFIQIGGLQSIKTAASVVAGDKLIGSSTDGQLARVAAGTATTDECVAVAYGSVAAGLSLGLWRIGQTLS